MFDGNIDAKTAGKVISSVIEQSIENNGGIMNIMQLIGRIEGRSSSYLGSIESINTAKAVMHMVQGKITDADRAIISRSDGAVTLLTAIEGNDKAWNSIKEAAGRELRSASQIQSDGDSGVRYKYVEDVEQGAKESGIGIEKPIEEYPYDTKKVIKDYIISTNENLLEKAKKFRTDKNAKFERINLSEVSQKEVEDIKRLTGADVSGYRHAINSTTLIHIENRHGQKGKHDNTMANLEDVARVEYVLENYDSVEVLKNEKGEPVYSKEFRDADNSPAPLLIYTKKINGTYYSAVAVAENSYKKMWVATAYISKNKEGITQELHDELSSLSTTSETNLASLPSNESVPQNETVVKDGDVFTKDGKKAVISEKSDVVNGIVVNGESKRMKETDAKGYSAAEKLGNSLKKPVKFVKGLYDAEGKMLDGVETDSGIFINTEAKNPIKWAVTHEFSHTMKKSAGKAWSAYQNFVINKMKRDGSYYTVFEAKAKAYKTRDAAYINEEIACDYIGETFDNVDELADFIRKDRGLAVKVRDFYYKALDKLGCLDEKKKAQLMWRDAYREAVLNVKDGKVESKSEPRFKASENVENAAKESGIDIEKPVASYPYDVAKVINDYVISTDEKFKNFIETTLNNESIAQNAKYYFKSIDEKTAEKIEELTGVNVKGFKIAIESRMIRHINVDHGPEGATDQSMANIEDIGRMEYVLKNYDNISYGGRSKAYTTVTEYGKARTADTVVYSKKINGTYYLVQAVPNTKAKTLFIVTAYINKKGALQLTDTNKAPVFTSDNGSAKTPSDDTTVSQDTPDVNTYSMQDGENNSKKSISGTRLSEVDGSPTGESADTATEETTTQKFIKPGAEPRRDVKVPESVKEGTKVRQFARTAAEAETLTEKTAEGVLQDVEDGKFNYTPISDKSAMSNAYASLDTMGVEWVEKKVSGAISSHSLDKKTVALAEVLMQRYSNEGQHEKVQKLIVDFAAESTRTAQSLQAISMLKKLDPNYEVSYIDKVVENLREEIIEKNNKKKFGKKHSADIEVSEELKTKLMEAKTEEEREAVRDEIYTEIAEQLPDSWIDKWNAWRYMAMLGNARTHVRNLAGNTAFMPMIASKNIAAKIVEPIVAKASGGKIERSKTFVANL